MVEHYRENVTRKQELLFGYECNYHCSGASFSLPEKEREREREGGREGEREREASRFAKLRSFFVTHSSSDKECNRVEVG